MKRPFPDACITHWLILEDISYYFSTVFYLDFTSALVPTKEGKERKQASKKEKKKEHFGAEIVAILRTRKMEKTTSALILTARPLTLRCTVEMCLIC